MNRHKIYLRIYLYDGLDMAYVGRWGGGVMEGGVREWVIIDDLKILTNEPLSLKEGLSVNMAGLLKTSTQTISIFENKRSIN